MEKANTGRKTATPARRATKSQRRPAVTENDIAHRAYDLYLARGRKHGFDLDDWLRAERELKVPRR